MWGFNFGLFTLRQLREDFQFLKEIIKEFFQCIDIVDKLNKFDEFEIKGWEIWLQVEFAIFMHNHARISQVEREVRYEFDKRSSKDKNICSIDFMIRQKNKHSSIPLEIKQHKNISHCIRYMFKDMEKYEKIRGSKITTERFLWCLGIHPTPKDEFYLNRLICENKFREIHPDYIFSKNIEGTSFSFTLI
ncbi:MAG: hypothetical protein A3F63_06185 [Pseudomonadales bacterium RIFCSPHIGHO2_12_FULL_40_16]|jgi:hypothetical protein|uniref:Uncharacterized protein n=1 Tax=Acinetobacter johnsonii TaxID=40214 RepID=A0A3Q8XHK2_ACIJO|nr:hypothetical protein [Acinetobacter johnsonii]AZN65023.1 hypothetical protein CFH90_13710 [Acinetobacter johnsonii]MCF7641739.1 hypothetical protein [Acinetobacter johnsonii]OHC22708.1 MAG: hypothetical protein A3F63_06185 [Pseudomonadales bacterium RIFCSPHIGHO2_12_FULL_40_16]